MMLVYPTVFLLLALVGGVMLTQTMAARYDYGDDLNTPGLVSTCQAVYTRMNKHVAKLVIDNPGLTLPSGVCTNPKNGDFVIAYWETHTHIYLHDNCGWIKKIMRVREGYIYKWGCMKEF